MKEVTIMTKYREILRLKSLDFSERNIALSCSVSRNTVAKVLAAAREKGLVGMEGKDYVVKDGDVILFRFNV